MQIRGEPCKVDLMRSGYNKRVIILFIFAIAAFLSWWLSSTGPSFIPHLEVKRHDPDYYLVNFTLTTMDDKGNPKHQLSADNMYHYPDDDTANLENPRLVVYQNEKDSWEIRADSGLVSEEGNSVFLQGDVFVNRLNTQPDHGLENRFRCFRCNNFQIINPMDQKQGVVCLVRVLCQLQRPGIISSLCAVNRKCILA